MAGPLAFWNLMMEVNPRGVREEAERPFRVAGLCGEPTREALRRVAGLGAPEARSLAAGRWLEAALPLGEADYAAVRECAFALTLEEAVRGVPVVTWRLPDRAGTPDVSEILSRFPNLLIALPRYIPLFRHEATERIIMAAAGANAKLALASALPGVAPWTAPLLPVAAFPDMVLMTKNQGMMCLRIAAAYGLPVDPRQRLVELGGVIGAAFGWRAIVRELVGLVPGGVGAGLKGGVAFAATVATGRAAQALYSSGRLPSMEERTHVFREAFRHWRQEGARG